MLDLGDVLYAPTVFTDAEGRLVMLAWMQELRSAQGRLYAGCLSLPRLLTLRGRPAPWLVCMLAVLCTQAAHAELIRVWPLCWTVICTRVAHAGRHVWPACWPSIHNSARSGCALGLVHLMCVLQGKPSPRAQELWSYICVGQLAAAQLQLSLLSTLSLSHEGDSWVQVGSCIRSPALRSVPCGKGRPAG